MGTSAIPTFGQGICPICTGLKFGVRIGFKQGTCLRSASANMGSAREHPSVVTEYLAKELSLCRMLGPFNPESQTPPVHINRIPKGHNTGKWRLVTDLSFPDGHSVNDGIDRDLCSLTYSTVDEVADLVARLGQGTLLAKVDIES